MYEHDTAHYLLMDIFISQSPLSLIFLLIEFSKVRSDFLLYMKKRQIIIQIFPNQVCKKAMVLDEKFKRTGHSVALTKVILLLLLLQRCLSDDACFRIHIVPSTTTLRDRLTQTSSKKAKPVGSLDASQGTVLLGSRTPILSEDRDGASVVVGLNQGLRKASWVGRWSGSRAVRCQMKDLA